MTESGLPGWFVPYLSQDSREWIWKAGVLQLASTDWAAQEESLAFYDAVGGTEQGRLGEDATHASYYDRPRYAELVKRAVDLGRKPVQVAVDLGCGDGRGTRMLLDSGVPRIVAVDFHLLSLQRLLMRLTHEEKERVVPIWAPVTMEPIGYLCSDVAICLEVLTTLPDPYVGLKALRKWLKADGGTVLVIEPAVEGSLLYALIEGNLAILNAILKEHRRYDRVRGHSLQVHLHTQASLIEFLRSCNLKVLEAYRIPGGAALTLYSLKKKGTAITAAELELIKLADGLEDFAPRMHAVIARSLFPSVPQAEEIDALTTDCQR
jgi:2-polyprenyl-3-methyl-5-hydroxy-6-metoxy-1,4-benzoquinol methylase